METMKKFLRNVLNKCGFELIRTKNDHDDIAKHLANVLRSRNIDCVLDVGANSGQYGLFLRSLGYSGHIVSFEPVTSVFLKLQATSRLDAKWHCHQYALGDRNEQKVINVYSSTMFSSFLPANDYSKNIWRSLNDVATETVEVRKLADIWTELTGHLSCRNYMLKLDTQGFDRFAFEGARERLDEISVLQSELSLIPVYDGMPDAYEVLMEYNKSNYLISGMYPINRDSSLAVIEYDCVMVKKIPQ
jgi:FkbM family methyltransferase